MIKRKKLLICLKYLSGSLLPILFWIFLTLGFDKPYIAVLTFAAAALHELGHILAAILTGVGMTGLFGRLNGLKLRLSGTVSYKKTAIIILSGPLANALLGLTLLALPVRNGYFAIFGGINLLSALSNLIPIEGYDGYRLLSLLGTSLGVHAINRIIEVTSFVLTVLTTLISLYLILRLGVGYWVFAVFFTSLITKTAENGKSVGKSEHLRENASF